METYEEQKSLNQIIDNLLNAIYTYRNYSPVHVATNIPQEEREEIYAELAPLLDKLFAKRHSAIYVAARAYCYTYEKEYCHEIPTTAFKD